MSEAHHLYRRWLDELWAGDYTGLHELVAEDFVGHWPGRTVRGRTGLVGVIEETRGMVADLRFTLEVGPIAEGDLVAGRWSGTGRTPDGEIRFFGNDLLRIAAGRIREFWVGSGTG